MSTATRRARHGHGSGASSRQLPKMLDLTAELAVQPALVAAVRRIDDDQCAVFTVGQSAVDGGFLVDRAADEVIDDINTTLEEAD